MKAQNQGSKRDNTGATPEQSPDGNRYNQDQEEVKQLPLAHPAAGGAIDTAGTQQLVSWRQIQCRRNTRETGIPACNRHRGASIDPAERLHSNRRLSDFDASLTFLLTDSDKQACIVFGRAQQRVRTRHVQPPVGTHRATNAVLDNEATAIKVKPHSPLQVQFVRCRDHSTTALGHGERCLGIHAESRIRLPELRHFHLNWVNRRQALGRRYAQSIVEQITPDLLIRQTGSGRWSRDRIRDAGATSYQVDCPAARTNLESQFAVSLELDGQLAANADRHKTIGEHRAEDLFANAA